MNNLSQQIQQKLIKAVITDLTTSKSSENSLIFDEQYMSSLELGEECERRSGLAKTQSPNSENEN